MKNNLKAAVAIILIIFAAVLFYVRYRKVKPPASAFAPPPPPAQIAQGPNAPGGPKGTGAGPRGGGPGWGRRGWGPPSPEERKRMREQFLKALDLTPEQQAKIKQIEKQYGEPRDRETMLKFAGEVSQILTPEQREKARQMFRQRMNRRLQRLKKILPPAEFQKFQEKLQKVIETRGGRFGPPPGGGPGLHFWEADHAAENKSLGAEKTPRLNA